MRVNSAKELAFYMQDKRLTDKLSQGAVADVACVRQATISAFESKPHASHLETLFKLLSALDLELEVRVKATSVQDQKAPKLDW